MAKLPAKFYWGEFLNASTEDEILIFQGSSVISEILALEGMTCKTFSNSTF